MIRYTLIYLTLFLISCSANRVESKKYKNFNKKIEFNYNYYFTSNDSVIYDFFYSIPYKQMVFEKSNKDFKTSLSSNINITNKGQLIYSKSWYDEIVAEYYEDTKVLKKSFSKSIKLPRKENFLSLVINDYKNNKYWFLDTLITDKEYRYLSNISVYTKVDDKFKLLKESFLEDKADTIWLKFQLLDDNFNERLEITLSEFGLPSKVYRLTNKDIKSDNINYFPINLEDFENKVKISSKYKDEYREIFLRLMIQDNEVNFNDLIGPFEYLLSRKDYLTYVDLDTLNRIDYIKGFWEDKYNENLLNEFYKRVKYSNINFFGLNDKGWQSDRGRIYILHGPPLSINFEFNEDGDFEIWTYASRKFIFKNKFGNYECYMCN
tara:strand:+ start:560 stop:1693 length:1134 start_codon:yes stop_codon:yes gene_type:complete